LPVFKAINLVAYHIGLGVSEVPPSSLAVGRVGHIQDGIDAIKPTVITFDQSQQQAIGSNWRNSMRGGMASGALPGDIRHTEDAL
jgi:hypothetical protein